MPAVKAGRRRRRPRRFKRPGTKEVFPWSDQSTRWDQSAFPDRRRHGKTQSPQEGSSFGAVLQQRLEQSQTRQVAFSKHALSRAEERGIEVTPTLLERLGDSVERAEAKGATNILALDQSLAFIVNVPNNRVITALSEAEMKDSIFTNIDGAVFL